MTCPKNSINCCNLPKQINRLNKHQLLKKLRLEIQPQGNTQKLVDYLGKLKGIGDAKLRGIAEQTTVDVFAFTKNIRTDDVNTLMDTYNITKVTAETLHGGQVQNVGVN